MSHKLYKNWNGDLSEYLVVGDTVDQEMANYFVEVVPPATMNGEMVQIGEAYNHAKGRATFATLKKINGQWTWMGHCHRGQTEDLTNCKEW